MSPLDLAALYRALSLNQMRRAYAQQQQQIEEQQEQVQWLRAQEYQRSLGLPVGFAGPKCSLAECNTFQTPNFPYCLKHQSNLDSWLDARKKREADELAHRP